MSKKKAKKKQTARSAWRPSRAVCLLGAACAAALILLVVVAIRVDSPGPVIFR